MRRSGTSSKVPWDRVGSVFEPATAAIIVYTAENTVSTLIWGLEPVEFVLHSVPVRTVGRAGILLSYCSTHVLWLRQALATQAYDLTPAQLNSSRLVTHSAHLIGAGLRSPLLTFALAMEPAHRPRPFGCGLRVTVGSVRTRTVVEAGPGYSGLRPHASPAQLIPPCNAFCPPDWGRFEKPTVNERTMLTFAPELQTMARNL